MGDLKACLEDTLSGRGRLVTLVGEPGIGKTRTAQELATYAGLRGAQVLIKPAVYMVESLWPKRSDWRVLSKIEKYEKHTEMR